VGQPRCDHAYYTIVKQVEVVGFVVILLVALGTNIVKSYSGWIDQPTYESFRRADFRDIVHLCRYGRYIRLCMTVLSTSAADYSVCPALLLMAATYFYR
jgi:hypothetical protein